MRAARCAAGCALLALWACGSDTQRGSASHADGGAVAEARDGSTAPDVRDGSTADAAATDAAADAAASDEAPSFSANQLAMLRKLHYDDGPPPADPSNRVADAAAARKLGQRLFFDRSRVR
jgi:hypothetical protein